MFGIGAPEILVLIMLAVMFWGANRLPEIGRSLNEAIRENRRSDVADMASEEEERV